jgi:hypothetical protein
LIATTPKLQAVMQSCIIRARDAAGCSFVRGCVRAIFSSLALFVSAGMRPRTPLARAIVLVLILKLIGIAGIKLFMFPDNARPVVDEIAMARAMGLPTSLR